MPPNGIVLTETWLTNESFSCDHNYQLTGYKSIHFERKTGKKGGGICAFVHDFFSFKVREDLSVSDNDNEILSLEIEKKNGLLGVIYRPPSGNIKFNSILTKMLNVMNRENKHVFLTGDFNIDSLTYDTNTNVQNVVNTLFSGGFIPTINKPTRVTPSSNKSTIIHKRIFKDQTIRDFTQTLQNTDWTDKITIKNKNILSPWMSKGLIKSSKLKQKLYIKQLKSRSSKDVHKTYKNLFEKLRKLSKKNFYARILTKYRNDIENTWSVIKEIIGKKQQRNKCFPDKLFVNGELLCCDREIGAAFNDFFVNVGPQLSAKIKTKVDYKNYLPNCNFQMGNSILSTEELQHAFKSLKRNKSPGHDDINNNVVIDSFPVINNVLYVFKTSISQGIFPDELKQKCNKSKSKSDSNILISDGKFTLGIFIDLSKAFDTVDHNISLGKLNAYGISGVTLKWFKSYLSERTQYIDIGGDKKTNKLTIKCGVPQGSILGPLLFLIYINDLSNCSEILNSIMFADDTNLFYSHKCINTLYETADLRSEAKSTRNFRVAKIARVKSAGEKLRLKLASQQNFFFLPHPQKYLQARFCKLWRVQKSTLRKSTVFTAENRGIERNKVSEMRQNVVRLPRVPKWPKSKSAPSLYLHQKHAARIITFKDRLTHSRPLLQSMKALNVFQLNIFQTLCFMYKAKNNDTPEVFNNTFHISHNKYTTRSAGQYYPPFRKTKNSQFSISYRGPHIWNSFNKIKKSIFVSTSENIFRCKLKNLLLFEFESKTTFF
ncbi:uncharacterized protein LOC130612998 [Hydractinia symbiolongicarpus]|uniref:uncharacterized protein LOC130612998 n=1 Tax=Hydractinia symbiolongicarpus TaxID=13093 RepID=UPI002550CDD2|nr:uncharacterized protein LOC130612998 [Hydractinia symbiolongicarpus]